MALRLVVGLGNPGPRYARTRHNVGLRLVERLAGGAPWKDFQGLGALARRDELLLGMPSTFMNESGRLIGALTRFFKVAPGETLVCFDDISLPLGRLRLRQEGSSGGQKGMTSIISHLGTQAVPRLRIGIGPQPEGVRSEDYVLAPFSQAQESQLGGLLEKAEEAVLLASSEGLEAAMNRFNKELQDESRD